MLLKPQALNLFYILPVLYHELRYALQGVALEVDVLRFDQRHDQFLGTQSLGDGSAIRVETNEFANVVTGNRHYFFVVAGQKSNQNL